MSKIALPLILVCIFSCSISRLVPENEYRRSNAYSAPMPVNVFTNTDTLFLYQTQVASAFLNNAKIAENIGFSVLKLDRIVRDKVNGLESVNAVIDSSFSFIRLEEFAFRDYYSRKLRIKPACSLHEQKLQIVPYIEFSVRRQIERDGGGGISMAYPTGYRIHWTLAGVVLKAFDEDKQVFSTGYYYTDMIRTSSDSVTFYDFPYMQIDSLLALCIQDLDREIKRVKYN